MSNHQGFFIISLIPNDLQDLQRFDLPLNIYHVTVFETMSGMSEFISMAFELTCASFRQTMHLELVILGTPGSLDLQGLLVTPAILVIQDLHASYSWKRIGRKEGPRSMKSQRMFR
jgi:hypothetical protein